MSWPCRQNYLLVFGTAPCVPWALLYIQDAGSAYHSSLDWSTSSRLWGRLYTRDASFSPKHQLLPLPPHSVPVLDHMLHSTRLFCDGYHRMAISHLGEVPPVLRIMVRSLARHKISSPCSRFDPVLSIR